MTEQTDNSKLVKGLINSLEPRDYITYILEVDFDIDSQLIAIRGLLDRNRNADKSTIDEIELLEKHSRHLKGVAADRASDERVDKIFYSTYQDAAHSMSAVGMLAPLIETIFYQCFQSIGIKFYPATQPCKTHERWNEAHGNQWDCHFIVEKGRIRKDIVKGIFQLSDAIGLLERFPSDLKTVLSALFAYRNSMFHHGFEWPVEARKRFAKRIQNEGWPKDWFSFATHNDYPWIFFMSDNFILHCDKTIELVLDAIGCFVRDELQLKGTTL